MLMFIPLGFVGSIYMYFIVKKYYKDNSTKNAKKQAIIVFLISTIYFLIVWILNLLRFI